MLHPTGTIPRRRSEPFHWMSWSWLASCVAVRLQAEPVQVGGRRGQLHDDGGTGAAALIHRRSLPFTRLFAAFIHPLASYCGHRETADWVGQGHEPNRLTGCRGRGWHHPPAYCAAHTLVRCGHRKSCTPLWSPALYCEFARKRSARGGNDNTSSSNGPGVPPSSVPLSFGCWKESDAFGATWPSAVSAEDSAQTLTQPGLAVQVRQATVASGTLLADGCSANEAFLHVTGDGVCHSPRSNRSSKRVHALRGDPARIQ